MKIVLLISFYLLSAVVAFAAEESDSAKTYRFREVVVTADRSPLDRLNSPAKVSQISKSEIDIANGNSLGEKLVIASGLFVRQYGSGESLQTISFRGMSSEHTLVLLDGVPLNNTQTGLTDLRLIMPDNIQQIELLHGGNSALYGSDALGGVVNIRSESALRPASVRFDAEAGSFGGRKFGMSSHILLRENAGITLGASTEYGDGNFPFIVHQNNGDIEAIRTNSDYHSQNIFLNSELQATPDTRLRLTLNSLTIERGVPGPLLTIANQGAARQSDEQFQAHGSLKMQLNERLEFNASVNFENAYEHYLDVAGLNPADNYYRNIALNALVNVLYSINSSITIISGAEWGRALANGNALTQSKERTHTGLFVHSVLSSEILQDVLKASLYPSLRFDHYDTHPESWSPKIGANVLLVLQETELALHSTLGRNFRVPTFNEYFYAGAGGIGNPALLPEKSLSFDAGLTIRRELLGELKFDCTYYSISTENRIIWLPAQQAFTSTPKNIGRTLSSGFETEIRWKTLSDYLTISGNYSYIDARKKNRESANDPAYDKQLPYVPLETGNIGLTLQVPLQPEGSTTLTLWLNDNYTGVRYIVEGSSAVLPAYHLFEGNIGLGFQIFGLSSTIKFEVHNIANISYAVMPQYPMPLRNQSLTLSITKQL